MKREQFQVDFRHNWIAVAMSADFRDVSSRWIGNCMCNIYHWLTKKDTFKNKLFCTWENAYSLFHKWFSNKFIELRDFIDEAFDLWISCHTEAKRNVSERCPMPLAIARRTWMFLYFDVDHNRHPWEIMQHPRADPNLTRTMNGAPQLNLIWVSVGF